MQAEQFRQQIAKLKQKLDAVNSVRMGNPQQHKTHFMQGLAPGEAAGPNSLLQDKDASPLLPAESLLAHTPSDKVHTNAVSCLPA